MKFLIEDLIININLINDWVPREKDYKIIIKRIEERINKKLTWYRYEGVNLVNDNLINIMKANI